MKSNVIYRNIAKVLFSNIITIISGVLVGFIIPKVMTIDDYAIYKIYTLYLSYLGILNIGFIEGVFLKYSGSKYEELDENLFSTITKFFFLWLLISTIVIFSIALIFLGTEYFFAFALISITVIPRIFTAYYQTISQMTSRFNEYSFRNVLNSIFTILSVIILFVLYKYFNYITPYYVYILVTIIIQFILLIWYIVTYRRITFGKMIEVRVFKKVLFESIKLGLPLLVANLVSTLILSIDRQFVSVLFDHSTYAVYAFSYNILALITTAVSSISTVLFPSLKSEKNIEKCFLMFDKILEKVCYLLIISLLCYFFVIPIINYFLPNYSDSYIYFRILLPGLVYQSIVSIVIYNYYKVANLQNKMLLVSLIVLIISILFNIFAYYIFKTTEAISIASVIVSLIWFFISILYLRMKYSFKFLNCTILLSVFVIIFYILTFSLAWNIGMILYLSCLLIFFVIKLLFFKFKKKKCNFIKEGE